MQQMNPESVKQYLYAQVKALCQGRPLHTFPSELTNQAKENSIISLLILCHNSLIDNALNQQSYLQNQKYIIDKKAKQLGLIASILGNFIFQDQNDIRDLASFNMTNFVNGLSQIQLVTIIKGIFPQTNVHTDNLPLYIPFRQELKNYQKIGNSNWKLTRNVLKRYSKVAEKQSKLDSQSQEKHNAYMQDLNKKILFLTASQKLFQEAQNTIEMVWSFCYIKYITDTLQPYSKQKLQSLSLNQFEEKVRNYQSQQQMLPSLLANLAMFIITNQFNYFKNFFNLFLILNQINIQKPIFKLMIYSNSLVFSILNIINQKQENQSSISDDIQKQMKLKSFNLNLALVSSRNSCWGQCLPVFYNQCYTRLNNDQNQLQIQGNNIFSKSQQQIIQMLQNVINQDKEKCYPFYPYLSRAMNERISQTYLQNVPTSLLKVIKYLPQQKAMHQIFSNAEMLEDKIQFQQIQRYLNQRETKQRMVELIKKQLNLEEIITDYEHFIDCWKSYHNIFSSPYFHNQKLDIQRQEQLLHQLEYFLNLANKNVLHQFRQIIYLPFQNKKILFSTVKSHLLVVQSILSKNIKADIIVHFRIMQTQNFRNNVLQKMQKQQIDDIWKLWARIILNHQKTFSQFLQIKNAPERRQNINEYQSILDELNDKMILEN